MKKIAGIAILVGLLALFVCAMVADIGFANAMIVLAGAIGINSLIALAFYLIMDGDL